MYVYNSGAVVGQRLHQGMPCSRMNGQPKRDRCGNPLQPRKGAPCRGGDHTNRKSCLTLSHDQVAHLCFDSTGSRCEAIANMHDLAYR